MKSQGITKFLDQRHQDVLDELDKLYRAVNDLELEGKISLKKNVKAIHNSIRSFQVDLLPHIKFDEAVIFTFIAEHVPKLSPMIYFLKAEHREFVCALEAFSELMGRLKAEKNCRKRQKIIKELKIKGIYLFCLLRNHIQTETQSVYAVIQEELSSQEKKALMNRIRIADPHLN